MHPIVEVKNLSKSFGSFQAVCDLSFAIEQGQVYGLLGQNGAGKSTTMRMMLGLIFPDKGSVHIKGKEFNSNNIQLLQHIGAIIEKPDMYLYLSGWENLKIFAALGKNKISKARLSEIFEQVGLSGREKDIVKAYSQGMKQRLGIAIAMVHDPELLILDEPTNGLDPQGIAEMRALIISLSKEHGKTVLISSHLLYEIEQMATHMVVLHKGKKIAGGRVDELMHPDETLVDIIIEPRVGNLISIESSSWGQRLVSASERALTFKLNREIVPELVKWLADEGVGILEVRSKHSLEAYFLSLTND